MCVLKFDKKIRTPSSGKTYTEIDDGEERNLKIYYGDIDHAGDDSTFSTSRITLGI